MRVRSCHSWAAPTSTSRRKRCNVITQSCISSLLLDQVGLRPSRKGGIRLEVDSKLSCRQQHGDSPLHLITATVAAGGLLVVHNYGHGGYGFQSSWGCARSVVELADAHAHAHCTKSSQSSCGAQPAAPVIAPSGGNAATGKQGGNSGSQPAASVGEGLIQCIRDTVLSDSGVVQADPSSDELWQ